MLQEIFCTVLKMNCAATAAAAVILPLKALLHRLGFPRRTLFFLWAVVAFRLICPVSAGTVFSVYNLPRYFARQTAPAEPADGTQSALNAGALFELPEKAAENAAMDERGTAWVKTKNIPGGVLCAAAYIWAAGACVLLVLGAVSAVRLKRRLRFAVRYCGNVFAAENIPAAFVFGLLKPKIYVPPNAFKGRFENITAHEKMHIKRRDHVSKLLAYVLLAIHWFNPFCRVLAKLFYDDMELCCDEAVMDSTGSRLDYAKTLLESAAAPSEKITYLCAVGFSGNITKRRIKNAVRYKKSGRLKRIGAAVICAAAAAALCTNAAPQNPPSAASAEVGAAVEPPSVAKIAEPKESAESEKTADKREEETLLAAEKEKPAEEKPAEKQLAQTARGNQAAQAEKPEPERQTESGAVSRAYKYDGDNVNRGVRCDSDGNISVSFALNAESPVNVAFYDSETGKEIDSITVAAGTDGTAHVFSGFDAEKTYDVVISGKTGSDWIIEGTYRIN